MALIVSGACIGISILLALVGKLLRHYNILSGGGAHSQHCHCISCMAVRVRWFAVCCPPLTGPVSQRAIRLQLLQTPAVKIVRNHA